MEALALGEFLDLISKAKKHYGKSLEPVAKKWQLTRNELDVVLFLWNNPQFNRATDIVSRRGIAKSHVSLSVARLECRGLLRRQFAPQDRRTAHLELTEGGLAIAQEGRQAQREFLAALYQGVTPEEYQLWQAVAEKICRNIGNL